jgi:soluble lytic murein transglycosylase-like protein
LGVIWAESQGNPNAKSSAGALGLMQVLSAEARDGRTDSELLEPGNNIRAGAKFLAKIKRSGDQLPEVASKYNAGAELDGRPHPSSSSGWGMREQPGYIKRVVAGNNFALGVS